MRETYNRGAVFAGGIPPIHFHKYSTFTHSLVNIARDAYITRKGERVRKIGTDGVGRQAGRKEGRPEGLKADRFDHNTPSTLDNVRRSAEVLQRREREGGRGRGKSKIRSSSALAPVPTDRPREGGREAGPTAVQNG